MSDTQKQLGDDWDERQKDGPLLITEILVDINAEMIKKLEAQAYLTDRKITVTIPVVWMNLFKEVRYHLHANPTPPTCWEYILYNNCAAVNGVPFEILPRYSFKDVKGMVASLETSIQGNYVALTDAPVDPYCVIHPNTEIDPKLYTESWIGKKAQEIGEKIKAEMLEFYPRYNPLTTTGEDLDKIFSLPRHIPPIERMRLEEGDPGAVPDPSLGGFMESDASLRERALADHREKYPQMKTAYANLNEDGSISVHGIQKPYTFEQMASDMANTPEAKAAIEEMAEATQEAIVDYLTPIHRYSRDYEGMYGDPEGEYVSYEDHLKKIAYKDKRIAELEGKATRWADNAVAKGAEIERLKDCLVSILTTPGSVQATVLTDASLSKLIGDLRIAMTCFAQDYEDAIAEKDAEIKGLEIQLSKLIVPPHEFRPFGAKKIWCDICGQREGSKTHTQKEGSK